MINLVLNQSGSSIDLYSHLSKLAMTRLGFTPADLEPLHPQQIEVPSKFSPFKDQYILGKLQHAETLRVKRLQLYHQEIKRIQESEIPTSTTKSTLTLKRGSRTANASKYNLLALSSQYPTPTSRIKEPIPSKQTPRIGHNRITPHIDKQQTQRLHQIQAQFKIKKLSLSQKKVIYRKALQYNSGLLDSVYRGVKRNHREQNKLLRSPVSKFKKFSVKENIKAQQAEEKRMRLSKVRRVAQLEYDENENLVAERLEDLGNRKKSEQEMKRRNRSERMDIVQLKQYEENLIQRKVKEIFKNNLTIRQDNAAELKEFYNKNRVKNKMSSYYKVEEATRNREIQKRRILKRNPFQSLFQKPNSYNNQKSQKYKTRTEEGEDEYCDEYEEGNVTQDNCNQKGRRHKHIKHQRQIIVSNFFENGEEDEVEENRGTQWEEDGFGLEADSSGAQEFLQRLRQYLQGVERQEGVSMDAIQQKIEDEELAGVDIDKMERKCKEFNQIIQGKSKIRDF